MVWFGDVKVAGTKFEGRQDILRMLALPHGGPAWQLIPEREYNNAHDPQAIAVIASQGQRRLHLGYLPKQVAAHLASFKKIGIVPRSIDQDGRYLYVDVFHSKKVARGCFFLILLPALLLGLCLR